MSPLHANKLCKLWTKSCWLCAFLVLASPKFPSRPGNGNSWHVSQMIFPLDMGIPRGCIRCHSTCHIYYHVSIYLSVYIYTIIYIGIYPYYDPYPHLIVLKSWTFVWLCSIDFSVAMGQSMSKPWFFAPEHTKINSIRSLPSIFASNLPEIDTKIQASCPWRLCGFPAAGGREHFLNSRISRKYDDGGFDDIMHRATVVIHYIRLFVKSICSFKLNGCSSFSLCMTCWIG